MNVLLVFIFGVWSVGLLCFGIGRVCTRPRNTTQEQKGNGRIIFEVCSPLALGYPFLYVRKKAIVRLIVHPLNVTRSPDVRQKIALDARDWLLDYFNGVENAHRAREVFNRVRKSYEWNHAMRTAFSVATHGLTAKEKAKIVLVVKFVP